MKDNFEFIKLLDIYAPLLTATQREIAKLYFNYDLSLGEIAEQKGVSRQSVSDCLNKCRKQLEKYEEKLGFLKAMQDLSREYSAYMTQVDRFLSENKCGASEEKMRDLKEKLAAVHKEFGVETINAD